MPVCLWDRSLEMGLLSQMFLHTDLHAKSTVSDKYYMVVKYQMYVGRYCQVALQRGYMVFVAFRSSSMTLS